MTRFVSWLVRKWQGPNVVIYRSHGDYEGPLVFPKEFAKQVAKSKRT